MALHKLKTWPSYFAAIQRKQKTFEVRQHDRDFAVGDTLRLEEFDPDRRKYTGQTMDVKVTYLMTGGKFGLDACHCVMAIKITGYNMGRT